MSVTATLVLPRFSPKRLLKVRINLAMACLVASLGCSNPESAETVDEGLIRADRIAAHTRFLSSDALEGRGVGGRAEALTTEYIAAQFALAGATPAGDDGTYFQAVPLVGVQTQPDAALSWSMAGNVRSLRYLDDFVAVNHRQEPLVEIDTEAVYVGHGIVAPEFDWDDYKGVDVKGKVVVLFTNEPTSDDAAFFGGPALTYYGRWTFKYEEARRQGAAGCLIIHTGPTAGYPWEVVRNSWSGREPFVKLEEGEEALGLAGWVHSNAAASMLAGTGKNLDELLALSESRDFEPIPLSIRVRARINSSVTPFSTRNVVGMIEGSDPAKKNEAVLYTAHWDHLGVGIPVDGDDIYNGAVDNATGVAVLLELARAFGESAARPARSILFAAVGAEEGGLRGSEYYGQHPYIPAGKTAVNINFDGLAPLGRTTDITLPGFERTTLRPIVEALAEESKLSIRPEAHPEQGYYYRSDHFSLAKVGVPAFSVKLGVNYVDRPEGWGVDQQEDYTANRYHQPSDEFNPEWDFSGLEQLARFGYELGLRVANQHELPTWNEGDEFLPARLKSQGK